MKKLSSIILIAALPGLLLIACNGGSKTGSIENADSTGNDTSKFNVVVDKEDIQFAVAVADNGLTEIELGKLAKEKGLTKQIKNFGALMIKDHTKINNKLAALADSKKITLPIVPGEENQKLIDELSKRSGKDFDMAYINNMIADHEKDIKLFETEAKSSVDPELKAFAKKTIPVLQRHLHALQGIHDSRK